MNFIIHHGTATGSDDAKTVPACASVHLDVTEWRKGDDIVSRPHCAIWVRDYETAKALAFAFGDIARQARLKLIQAGQSRPVRQDAAE